MIVPLLDPDALTDPENDRSPVELSDPVRAALEEKEPDRVLS